MQMSTVMPSQVALRAIVWTHTSSQGRSTDVLAEKKVSEQEFRQPQHNHLTTINAKIDRRDNGRVLIAQRISNEVEGIQ